MKILQLFFFFFFVGMQSQQGFQVVHHEKTTIPFQFINNLIFIPVNVNGVDLTFLLDTGVTFLEFTVAMIFDFLGYQ